MYQYCFELVPKITGGPNRFPRVEAVLKYLDSFIPRKEEDFAKFKNKELSTLGYGDEKWTDITLSFKDGEIVKIFVRIDYRCKYMFVKELEDFATIFQLNGSEVDKIDCIFPMNQNGIDNLICQNPDLLKNKLGNNY